MTVWKEDYVDPTQRDTSSDADSRYGTDTWDRGHEGGTVRSDDRCY